MKKKYFLLLPVIMIIIAFIGISSHKSGIKEGIYYLIEKDYTNHKMSINKEEYFTVSGDEITFTNNKSTEFIQYDKKKNELILGGKLFWTHSASGELRLTNPKNTEEKIDYISKSSPMFKSYKNGTAKFK